MLDSFDIHDGEKFKLIGITRDGVNIATMLAEDFGESCRITLIGGGEMTFEERKELITEFQNGLDEGWNLTTRRADIWTYSVWMDA